MMAGRSAMDECQSFEEFPGHVPEADYGYGP